MVIFGGFGGSKKGEDNVSAKNNLHIRDQREKLIRKSGIFSKFMN